MSKKQTITEVARAVVKHYGTHLAVAKVLGYGDLRNVSAWVNGIRPFPAQHCVRLEKHTGGYITRKMLRPDDWELFWPELATQATQPV